MSNLPLYYTVCPLIIYPRCNDALTYTYQSATTDANIKELEEQVMKNFFRKVRLNVVKDKAAYILSELLRDFEEISKEFGLEEPPVRLKHTYQLKKMLISRLGEEISICKLSNRDVVYPKSVDPLCYSQVTLKGHGLCDDDIAKAFSNLVRRKLANRDDLKWPPTPEQFLSSLKSTAPLPCIYNAIVWSVNPRREVNLNGYVETILSIT